MQKRAIPSAGPVLSRQYSHFVTGMISVTITVTMLIVPLLVNVVVPNNTAAEWNIVFLITAGVMVRMNVME